jgi:hypothetical protein
MECVCVRQQQKRTTCRPRHLHSFRDLCLTLLLLLNDVSVAARNRNEETEALY